MKIINNINTVNIDNCPILTKFLLETIFC